MYDRVPFGLTMKMVEAFDHQIRRERDSRQRKQWGQRPRKKEITAMLRKSSAGAQYVLGMRGDQWTRRVDRDLKDGQEKGRRQAVGGWACKKLKPRMERELEGSQNSVFLVQTFQSLGHESFGLSFFIQEWGALDQMIAKTLSIYVTGSLRSQGDCSLRQNPVIKRQGHTHADNAWSSVTISAFFMSS